MTTAEPPSQATQWSQNEVENGMQRCSAAAMLIFPWILEGYTNVAVRLERESVVSV